MDNVRLKIQIDFGVGDVMVPGPRMIEYPVFLGGDTIQLLAYPTGESAMLLKVRTRDAKELDSVLERMYAIEGFTAARSYVALSTYLERGPRPSIE
jgi:hypothetical protein